MLAAFDPWILAFSLVTVAVTIWMGFRSAKSSKSAADFFVAGRSVSVGWNASAISGEYLSAASFMGVAGMVMSSGYDALWYPVCYACGYLFLLLFIAGPLRRFGAYTIPDFAEGRYDSPVFRKIAVIFVLFIGFFYTMPQMKGAGTTLAYIFPGLPYWVGVVLVGAVITLNVALGGMKGITLVQAFQYWAKMFAISVPIFVLMSVYGGYGKQVGGNNLTTRAALLESNLEFRRLYESPSKLELNIRNNVGDKLADVVKLDRPDYLGFRIPEGKITLLGLLRNYGLFSDKEINVAEGSRNLMLLVPFTTNRVDRSNYFAIATPLIATNGFEIVREDARGVWFADSSLAKQIKANHPPHESNAPARETFSPVSWKVTAVNGNSNELFLKLNAAKSMVARLSGQPRSAVGDLDAFTVLRLFAENHGLDRMLLAPSAPNLGQLTNKISITTANTLANWERDARAGLRSNGVEVIVAYSALVMVPVAKAAEYEASYQREGMAAFEPNAERRLDLPAKAPKDETWLNPFGPLTTNLISLSTRMTVEAVNGWVRFDAPSLADRLEDRAKALFGNGVPYYMVSDAKLASVLIEYARFSGKTVAAHTNLDLPRMLGPMTIRETNWSGVIAQYTSFLTNHGVFLREAGSQILAMPPAMAATSEVAANLQARLPLPAKAPKDETWLNPFGPLTTKAAKAAKPSTSSIPTADSTWHTFTGTLPPRDFEDHVARFLRRPNDQWMIEDHSTATTNLLVHYARFVASDSAISQGNSFSLVASPRLPSNISSFAFTGAFISEPIGKLERAFLTNGITVLRQSGNSFIAFPTKDAVITPVDPKPYALLYTYSLIIALVCGTAGLPHILVRFYTNPDGVAAKRTTMWVMILIGIFYVFPPVFGVMGRNLMPLLYEGTGAKGTDKVVLELPKVLDARANSQFPMPNAPTAAAGASIGHSSLDIPPSGGIPWGSILSGITCAGAFAAFMSTFSGLLVSMTGALAHDVYGRMLRPNSTPAERMRMFKFCAVAVGTVAVALGSFVEPLQINFMVGQAFAIAAASYFPLLFMSVWWRGMTMRGAAAGMLTGGVCALAAVTLTNFSDLKWIALGDFWAAHPLLRILCEQPAIWTVPLAIGLMVAVSKLTRATVPADVRMKMLVLHAPEKLGLKQEYIKEHEAHGH